MCTEAAVAVGQLQERGEVYVHTTCRGDVMMLMLLKWQQDKVLLLTAARGYLAMH